MNYLIIIGDTEETGRRNGPPGRAPPTPSAKDRRPAFPRDERDGAARLSADGNALHQICLVAHGGRRKSAGSVYCLVRSAVVWPIASLLNLA